MRRNSDRNSVLPASDLVENSWTTRANNGEGSRDAVINQGMRPVGQVGNPIGDVSCIRHVHNQRVVSWTTLGCENGLNSIPIRCITKVIGTRSMLQLYSTPQRYGVTLRIRKVTPYLCALHFAEGAF